MERILVCLDASQRAPFVLVTALGMARGMGAKLRLFRAVGLPPEVSPNLLSVSPNDLPGILLAQAKRDLEELARDVPTDVLDGVYVHTGTGWDGICRAAQEHNADLVVIGSHGYGALDRVLGTTAAKVVNHIDRTVLVVRPKEMREAATANKTPSKHSHNLAIVDAVTGGIAGAAVGAMAGPAGILAGGVLGTTIGALAGVAFEGDANDRLLHDEELDREIGIAGGPMGAASPMQALDSDS